MSKKKTDPREALTWWPRGYCSAWSERGKKCMRAGGCVCIKPDANKPAKEKE